MNEILKNPFNITKAVDFNDQQINDYWVEIPNGEGSFREMLKPTSPMPVVILGGKGSGKTHLMRYFSYPLQKIRHSENIVAGIQSDGYIGVYFRCSGLNAGRFSGKSQSDEIWTSVFSYYMELWFAQQLLGTIRDMFEKNKELRNRETQICKQITDLFDKKPDGDLTTLNSILAKCRELQRKIDSAVNNCPITGSLIVSIDVTRGRFIFGIPQILSRVLSPLDNVLFLYLVDEFENLDELQQRYLNTLVREKEPPTSFRIGVRLYGLRTLSTFCADEINKEGSEHETVYLDTLLRENKHYDEFSKQLIIRRIREAGMFPLLRGSEEVNLDTFFETPSRSPLGKDETAFMIENYPHGKRPYFASLERNLSDGIRAGVAWGISSKKQIPEIIKDLSVCDYPLLEKANILLFYRDWYKSMDLMESAKDIKRDCEKYLQKPSTESRHHQTLLHFRSDLIAQLCRECKQPQRYYGLNTFIDMSRGMPRNLLIILKEILRWSLFNGEAPFGDKPISLRSQKAGIDDASEWFFRDARMTGASGPEVQKCISQLAELFREVRFADKPSECSPCTFSINILECSEKAQLNIKLAESHSLLTSIQGGQKDRNTKRVDMKYQINSMLAPRWNLPVYRRGALSLTQSEANAIFDPEYWDEFEGIKRARAERMTAPFFGKRGKNEDMLPGFDND